MSRDEESAAPENINRLQAAVPPALALLAGMQLELFTALGDRPQSAAEVAAALNVDEERLARLLHALVLAGLVEREGARFRNGAEAARFLVKGQPGYIGGSHELTSDLWQADLQSAASIRTGRPAARHDFAAMDEEALQAFLRGLKPYALATGRALAQRFDLTGGVIDVGGGSGGALLGLLESRPALRCTLLELPPVLRAAEALLAAEPWRDRIRLQAGDILAGPPADRHDTALLRAVVQVLAPDEAARAIRHSAACLVPGGRLLITGSGILNDDRLSPATGVFLNLTLMNLYPGGRAYTEAEHFAWLREAGCVEPRHETLPGGSPLIWAIRTG
jgi:SAM-dependent methyltransferase